MNEQLTAAFNEWMRRYIENPSAFEQEWKTIMGFLQEQNDGKPLSYGHACTAYLQSLGVAV